MDVHGIASVRCLLFALTLALIGCPGGDGASGATGRDDAGISVGDGGSDPDRGGDGRPDTDPDGDESPAKPDPIGGDTDEDPGDPRDPGDPDDEPDPDDPDDPSTTATRFFMPTTEAANTRSPELMFDAAGNLHAIYPAYAGGHAYYAFCPDNCDDPTAMRVVDLEVDTSVTNAALALTRAGRPRVLIATARQLWWAECDGSCGKRANWRTAMILDHAGDREVTGNALALDGQDRPRFVMHTYLAFLGVGQKTPQTFYAQCDGACTTAGNWRFDTIQEQIWHSSELRFDADGRAHLATVAVEFESGVPARRLGAYLVCEQGCTTAQDWSGIVLAPAYEDYIQEIRPSIAMALTSAGGPRIVLLAKSATGGKELLYFECDETCEQDNWRAVLLADLPQLGSGVDIDLDARDRPRFVFTADANIGLYYCDGGDCTSADAIWNITRVEFAGEVPPDGIILRPNCTVDAWVLHDPSLALGAGGSARVAYQATDLSGTVHPQDPTMPECLAGKDMTLSRMALLPSYRD